MRIFGKSSRYCLSIGAMAIMTSGCASVSQSHDSLPIFGASSPIAVTQAATPPSGLVAFCARNTDMCQNDTDELFLDANSPGHADAVGYEDISARSTKNANTTLPLTPDLADLLGKVNTDVNRAIIPASDRTIYGQSDYWTLPLTSGNSRYGDCEDYVLEKRLRLISEGIDPGALLLSVVTSAYSGRHLVLVVSTDHGDYVLDNLRSDIVGWKASNYTWLSRQSSANLLSWSWIALTASSAGPQQDILIAGAN